MKIEQISCGYVRESRDNYSEYKEGEKGKKAQEVEGK